jgi:mono/diheme cytochrome c family protein
MTRVIAAMVAAAASTAWHAAAADDAPSAAHGRQVFTYWCAPCHGAGPGHPGTDALAAKYKGSVPAELEKRIELPASLIRGVVRNGISVMPIFRKTEISDADLADIVAYLSRP